MVSDLVPVPKLSLPENNSDTNRIKLEEVIKFYNFIEKVRVYA